MVSLCKTQSVDARARGSCFSCQNVCICLSLQLIKKRYDRFLGKIETPFREAGEMMGMEGGGGEIKTKNTLHS